jgi:tetratricopeptide (TPR) repeat protein
LLNLARICFAARKFNDAREFCDALYVICNKIYDSNDIRLFTFREIFIQVCVEQKDYDLADAEYLRADLMDNPKITEERKLNIKMAFCSMLINKFLDVTIKNVMPYENAEKLYLDEAEKILRQIYPYSLNKYGENHLEMLIWYQNMANIYNYRGQYYDALSFDRKIVKVREQKLGKMNGQLAAAYYNLADDCFKIANVEKKSAHDALDYIEKADEIISKVYPDSQMERNTKELIIRIKEYQANYNFA